MKLRIVSQCSLLAMALLLTSAVAFAGKPVTDLPPSAPDRGAGAGDRDCATPEPTAAELEGLQAQLRASARLVGPTVAAELTIPIAFHVITNGDEGNVPDSQIEEQVRVMNERYAGSGYQFRLLSIDRTDRNAWFHMGPLTGAEKQCKMTLAVDPAHTLNVYTCGLPCNPSPNKCLLGWSFFPFSLPEDHYLHGVVIDYGSLPGGSDTHYDMGLTLVHESGHYLGLFHTFQGGCVDPGDYVDDTPFEASPAFGCPEGRNTCPQPGDDPIHNYMDYTYDACYTEFTPGQFARINAILPVYRPSLFLRGQLAQANTRPDAAPDLAAPAAAASVELRGAVPNPFNRETTLRYSLPVRQRVSISVYNVAGQRVASLVDGEQEAGEHLVSFAPRGIAAGMYFTVLRAGGLTRSRSVVFIP